LIKANEYELETAKRFAPIQLEGWDGFVAPLALVVFSTRNWGGG
jgi:hypothetical protein